MTEIERQLLLAVAELLVGEERAPTEKTREIAGLIQQLRSRRVELHDAQRTLNVLGTALGKPFLEQGYVVTSFAEAPKSAGETFSQMVGRRYTNECLIFSIRGPDGIEHHDLSLNALKAIAEAPVPLIIP